MESERRSFERSIRALNIDFIRSQEDLDEVFKRRSVVRPKKRAPLLRARSMVLFVTRDERKFDRNR